MTAIGPGPSVKNDYKNIDMKYHDDIQHQTNK